MLGYAGASGRRYGMTGVERVVQLLVEGLDSRRFAHHVAYPRVGELFDRYAKHATVLDLEPRRRYDRAYAAALVAAIREHAIDLVVSHGLRFDFHAALACREAGVPHVVVRAVALADETMPWLHKFVYGMADRWTLRGCTGVVAVSEASKRRMVETQGLRAAHITVIPNGVELPEIPPEEARAARHALGVADDELLVGGAGQLIPRKAFDVLVEALGTLKSEHSRLAGLILGEGPERSRLEAQARTQGVRLLLPGFQPHPHPAMAGFDVLVLPSRAEGMPLVVLEAMALGIAVVATPVAGTGEVIVDRESGILVPPGEPAALAVALHGLLSDPSTRARIAAAGRERVRAKFGLAAMLQRFDAYLWTISRKKPMAPGGERGT